MDEVPRVFHHVIIFLDGFDFCFCFDFCRLLFHSLTVAFFFCYYRRKGYLRSFFFFGIAPSRVADVSRGGEGGKHLERNGLSV